MGMDSSFCFGTLTSLVLIIVYVTSHSKAILLRVICLHPITFSLSSLFYYSYLNTIYICIGIVWLNVLYIILRQSTRTNSHTHWKNRSVKIFLIILIIFLIIEVTIKIIEIINKLFYMITLNYNHLLIQMIRII